MVNKPVLRLILGLGLLVACVPAAPNPSPAPTPELPTPTPEVFNPLSPSPTPSGSALPLTCQVTDLKVYVSPLGGYCFAYPPGFTLDESAVPSGGVSLLGPALDQSLEPLRASLSVSLRPVPAESDLTRLVDAYLTQVELQNPPQPIERAGLPLGGQPAEMLSPVPGRLNGTVALALHSGYLFTLLFQPVDLAVAQPGFDDLLQTVTGSFAFVTGTAQVSAEFPAQTITRREFDRTISLSYDPRLAPWVEAATLPEVPLSNDVLFSETHPAYVQFRFLGFQGGRPYDLPLLPFENRVAQVMFFPTHAFAAFGDDPQGFTAQWLALQDLLELGLDPARCSPPVTPEQQALPFLPWLNARQVFCAQPALLRFAGGSGVRYLTYYAQDESPALDGWVFYTFQGVTDDSQFYVSAHFPVATGIFPTEPPANQVFPDPTYWTTLSDQLTQLNAQAPAAFAPSLELLDALVQSIALTP
jgi:hypothetical protein